LIPKIEPATITIAGNADTLIEVNSISLGTLDVAELTKNYKEEIALILPNGVKNIDAVEKATVSLSFEGVASKQFEINAAAIKKENVAKGDKIEIPDGKITVTVRGNASDIEKLKATDITLYIDCKNQALSKGANRMNVYCGFPEDYKVGAVGKCELTVKVS